MTVEAAVPPASAVVSGDADGPRNGLITESGDFELYAAYLRVETPGPYRGDAAGVVLADPGTGTKELGCCLA